MWSLMCPLKLLLHTLIIEHDDGGGVEEEEDGVGDFVLDFA